MYALDYPRHRFEIIFVDNGSSDRSAELVAEGGATLVTCAQRGRAKALNAGLAAARGEIICTTDPSCRPEPGWVRTVVAAFRDPGVGCVAGEIKLLREGSGALSVIDFQERCNYMSPLAARQRSVLPFLPFADGANASFSRRVFDEIGPFEATFYKAADVEICYRLLMLTSYRIKFEANAVVWETGEPTLRALLRQRYRIGLAASLLETRFPHLFAASRKGGWRRHYWAARALGRGVCRLALVNLRGMFGGNARVEAFDANVRLLMSASNAIGRARSRAYLARQAEAPAPIDAAAERVFVREPRLEARIIG